MYSSILMLGNDDIIILPEENQMHKKLSDFEFNSAPQEPTIGTKFTISFEFGPLQVICFLI